MSTPIISFGIPILVEQPTISVTAGDFIDYIFQFPDQGSFLRDPVIQAVAPPVNGSQPGVQLLIFNPVESLQGTIIPTGNSLVLPPQLANSTVPLSGFWAMITLQSQVSTLPTSLTSHSNIQIVNDRTLMFARQPSVLLNKIDVSHINIVINIFGVYVADGLQIAPVIPDNTLFNDASTVALMNDAGTSFLTAF